jgi:S-DNA-T family DNA segregation ATPase FtsK/SpoIIIE
MTQQPRDNEQPRDTENGSEPGVGNPAGGDAERRHLRAVDTPADGVPAWGTAPAPDQTGTGRQGPAEGPDQDEETDPVEADPIEDQDPRDAPPLPVIVPGWLRSRSAFAATAGEWCTRTAHIAAFHLTRSPWYWLRATRPALRTSGRAAWWVCLYAVDADGWQVRRALANSPAMGHYEGMTYGRITQQHHQVMLWRLAVVAAISTVTACIAFYLAATSTLPQRVAVLAVGVPFLAWFSRDPARPVVTVPSGRWAPPPAFDRVLVAAALDSLGISKLSQGLKAEGLKLTGPIHRDGAGWRADVDLPMGVTAGEVMEKRDKLAASLRRPLACVWPSADTDVHEGRLILWCGDKAPNKAKPAPWALARAGKVDLFESFPVGTNPQGRAVTICLMFASMIIGSIPRMGKTFSLRVILLAAALDVRAELHVYDLKGGADMRCLGPVCHRFRIGDDEEDIAYLAADMAELRKEMKRRYKVLRGLPESICPEGKITPELARRKDLRLHPIVVAVDETQFGFEHPTYGKQLEEDMTDLGKRGPAAGIIPIYATQRPDAKSLPTGISSNAVLRYCLKVMKHDVNDMVLGSGMHTSGIRATMFARSDLGIGYLAGEGDDPQIVTFGYVDAPTAKTIAGRARAAPHAAGTITGYAADLDPEPVAEDPVPTLLDDLAHVMPEGEDKVWSTVLIERLTAHRPDTYTGWTPTDLGNATAAYGLDTVQIKRRKDGKAVNNNGIDRTKLHTVITERNERRGQGESSTTA